MIEHSALPDSTVRHVARLERAAVLRAAVQTLLLALSVSVALTIAFFLRVYDALFLALWHRRAGMELYTLLFAVHLLAPLVLFRRARRVGMIALAAGGLVLAAVAAIATEPLWLAAGLLSSLLAPLNLQCEPAPSRLLARATWGWVRRRRWTAGALVAVAVGAGAAARTRTPINEDLAQGSTREVRVYVGSVLREARARSLFRDTVTWSVVTDSAAILLRGVRSTTGAHAAVAYVLRRLGDGHSGLEHQPPGESPRLTAFGRATSLPQASLRPDGVAYLEIPWFVDGLSDNQRWRAALAKGLVAIDSGAPCGWILDLRRNVGGNLWPMLNGVAPLLPQGVTGGVEIPQRGAPASWWIVGGRAYSAVPVLAGFDKHRKKTALRFGAAPVAVLTGRRTASSGEAIAIAFKGREQTRFFGDTTAGLTTANTSTRLADGARLALTIGVDIDRTGRRYFGGVVPDEVISNGATPADSARVLERAAKWVIERDRCESRRAGAGAPRTE